MKRNFMLTKYYKFDNHVELHPKGLKAENNCIDKAMQELIKKVGESYYETIQEQRVHNISLS